MKNKMKLLGIIAIAALIGFSMAACDDGGGGGGGGTTSLGDTPVLSGKVYLSGDNRDNPSYTAYTGGKLNVSAYGLTQKGTIENGQFSFTLGTPGTEYLWDADDVKEDYFYEYTNVTVSPSSAKFFIIPSFSIDTTGYYGLSRENVTIKGSSTSASGTYEWVWYCYADKDCTISGTGKTTTEDGDTYTTKNFNLALKAGWNTVYSKNQISATQAKFTSTVTISLSNPGSLKWVLEEDW
jgi:hypothetical protein